MAIINCPECGKELSSYAISCPNCGYPISRTDEIHSDNNIVIEENKEETPTVKINAIIGLILSCTVVLSPVGLILSCISLFRALRKKATLQNVRRKVKGTIISIVAIAISALIIITSILFYVLHEHEFSEWVIVAPATCTETGNKTHYCLKCFFTENKTTSSLGHSWEAATCQQPKRCRICGVEEGGAVDHNWIKATCVSAKKCKCCNKVEGKALGHKKNNYQCERCGESMIEISDVPNIIDIYNLKHEMNSVGGIDVYATFGNKSDKTIDYITMTLVFFNDVGDIILNDIGFDYSAKLHFTGPLEPHSDSSEQYWKACFYNSTFGGKVVIDELKIEYSDGSSIVMDYTMAREVVVDWR